MAAQQRSQAAPSRKSRRLKSQTPAGADMQRVRKRAKNKKNNERKKLHKARGEDAWRRLQAGDVMCDSCQLTAEMHRAAHHPHAARSGQGAAPATGSTCDAATSTDDLNPVTIEIAESEHGITAVNVVEERNAAAPRERANTTLVRIVDELYTWVPVVACAALFYGHWRGDFDARLIGLRG